MVALFENSKTNLASIFKNIRTQMLVLLVYKFIQTVYTLLFFMVVNNLFFTPKDISILNFTTYENTTLKVVIKTTLKGV
jgi:hypothetical protein